jgi:hypothetical protein
LRGDRSASGASAHSYIVIGLIRQANEPAILFVANRSLGADVGGPLWVVEAMPGSCPARQQKQSLWTYPLSALSRSLVQSVEVRVAVRKQLCPSIVRRPFCIHPAMQLLAEMVGKRNVAGEERIGAGRAGGSAKIGRAEVESRLFSRFG